MLNFLKRIEWRIAVRWLVLMAIVAAGLGLTAFHIIVSRQIGNHYAQLRGAGFPTTVEEAARAHEIARQGENAADGYLTLFAELRRAEILPRESIIIGTNRMELPMIAADKREHWKQLLDENMGAYDLIPKAIEKPHAMFNNEWNQGFAMLLKPQAKAASLLRLIQLHALFAAHERNKEALLRDIEYSLKVAESFALQPIVVCVLNRNRGRQNACRMLELLLNSFEVNEGELARLASLFELDSAWKQLQAALGMERAATEMIYARPFESGIVFNTDPADSLWVFALDVSGLWKFDRLRYLERAAKVERALGEPDATASMREFVKEFDLAGRSRFPPLLSDMILPGLSQSFTRMLIAETEIRLARTAIALQRHRLKHGAWPESLSFLPAHLNDPFTGAAFKYKASPTDCLVYSVGPDLVDERGAHRSASFEAGDIPMHLRGRPMP
jgi:hypothetical protein